MPQVRILTDSLADIPPEILKALDITTVPTVVRFGSTVYRDRVDLSPSEFYRRLKASAELPSTSQPPIGVFEEIYDRLAETTDQILAIHTIASLSGIYNASVAAASNIQNARIELIDSRQVSMSLGWLVIIAARAACEGRDLDQVKAIVQAAMARVHIIAMLDTLEYAYRGGRLGKGAALLGTLLNVKPLLSIKDGEIVPVENVRTQKRALERLATIALRSGTPAELSIIHAQAPQQAAALQAMLAPAFPKERMVMSETGPVLGTHVGPGTVGIAWVDQT